jgi:hypothetical protein
MHISLGQLGADGDSGGSVCISGGDLPGTCTTTGPSQDSAAWCASIGWTYGADGSCLPPAGSGTGTGGGTQGGGGTGAPLPMCSALTVPIGFTGPMLCDPSQGPVQYAPTSQETIGGACAAMGGSYNSSTGTCYGANSGQPQSNAALYVGIAALVAVGLLAVLK